MKNGAVQGHIAPRHHIEEPVRGVIGDAKLVEGCVKCVELCSKALATVTIPEEHWELRSVLEDCRDVCTLATELILRRSPRHAKTCALCAVVCEECARLCEMHALLSSSLLECADGCRRCAAGCRMMAPDAAG